MQARTPDRILWAVERLDPAAADELLEIGCGNGAAVASICPRLDRGRITAIDRSPAAIAAATRRNAAHIASGKAVFLATELACFESSAHRFDKAFAVNVNVFWLRPTVELRVLARVLKPGGALCLVFQPPSESQLDSIATACAERLVAQGFVAIRTVRHRLENGAAVCVHALWGER
ncbi:class I SAM-dependent methyltransferase [Lysobacter antibioticus]|uniref:Methyltransferase domain protein n=1 Tax=Lysobacter antibioticus TaxID=84531 RepID=A0A0S2FDZ1_LYSAN|nr:class I SAM-dependent methyltransferase [Lysobacter antibioticus]ALN81775.1 methyltransferase domain protein [Lysobacter antibioticus]